MQGVIIAVDSSKAIQELEARSGCQNCSLETLPKLRPAVQ